MTWISFAVVALLLYMPVIGLGYLLPDKTIYIKLWVPFWDFNVLLPCTKDILLLLYSVGGWLLLCGLLLIVDQISGADLLRRAKLRNGLLFASRPYISINLVFWLSILVISYSVIQTTLLWLHTHALAWEGLLAVKDALPRTPSMAVVLSVLSQIASAASRIEQRTRYTAAIRRQQHRHKRQQKRIVIPVAQRMRGGHHDRA